MFIRRVQAQRVEGYEIACCQLNGEIVAAAGYRVVSFLAWGRVLYIDDLITHPERKRLGLGGALLDWLIEEGKRRNCDEIHLDTGFSRHDAHRLYLNKGFKLGCHHLSLQLTNIG
jgi:GNAT superfamily N-acetyltransferase